MGGQLARRGDAADLRRAKRLAECRLQRFRRQPAGAQQHRGVAVEADDRAFQPHRTGAAIQHGGDAARQARHHMIRGRGADPARGVGDGRGHRPAELRQQGARHRMRGHAQGHGVQTRPSPTARGRAPRAAAAPASADRARRPAPARSAVSRPFHQCLRLRRIRDMHDQRIEGGPALGRIDRRDRGTLSAHRRQGRRPSRSGRRRRRPPPEARAARQIPRHRRVRRCVVAGMAGSCALTPRFGCAGAGGCSSSEACGASLQRRDPDL